MMEEIVVVGFGGNGGFIVDSLSGLIDTYSVVGIVVVIIFDMLFFFFEDFWWWWW